MNRRERLEAMLAEEPGDAFLRYSLAMELEKEGQIDECLARLTELQSDDVPYVPAFHMAGQILARLGRVDEARGTLRQGIEAARAQGKQHDAAEMADLLATLGSA